MLAVLFHDDISEVELRLSAPRSQVERIGIRYDSPGVEGIYGYADAPKAFLYVAPGLDEDGVARVRRHYSDSADERPFVQLTTASEGWRVDAPADKTDLMGSRPMLTEAAGVWPRPPKSS
jgi:hypothetical protein